MDQELSNLSDEERSTKKAKRMQKYLDNGYGCCALKNPIMAEVMQDALKYHDGDKYELIAWCIMPNHVHVLIRTKEDLSKIIQSWKSFTGKWAKANNKKYNFAIPEGTKKFWQPEFWDRFIRNEKHFENIVKYILNNPEKALKAQQLGARTSCSMIKKVNKGEDKRKEGEDTTQQELRSPSSFIISL